MRLDEQTMTGSTSIWRQSEVGEAKRGRRGRRGGRGGRGGRTQRYVM